MRGAATFEQQTHLTIMLRNETGLYKNEQSANGVEAHG